MADPFKIIKDSSIWKNSSVSAAIQNKDPYLRIGIVKKVFRETRTTDLRYLVELQDRNDSIEVSARMLRRFGGAFNYEDVILRGYKIDHKPDATRDFTAKAGDSVLVAFINGEAREGIILGGLSHPARASTLSITEGPLYKSEFNGIEKSINKDGEYSTIFKGIPTNIATLDARPNAKLPAPKYNTDVGTTYVKFDKTGSWEVSDNAKKDLQRIKIDKKAGQILVDSGKISLKLTKASEMVELKSKVLKITSDDLIEQKTKKFATEATESAKIKSPKVAFGKDGVELLDQLAKLIDALGKVQNISPVGPCTLMSATPQWSGVEEIKAKIKEITGSL